VGAAGAWCGWPQAGAEQARQRKTAWTAGVRRALIVVCVFFIFQQISGINVP
jgi:MFS transporter, SP family, arabinose:H+ symporter